MREIHLLNPMANAFGGSERRTLALADLLQGHAKVRIWSFGAADPRLHSKTPATPVDVSKLRFPREGTLVVVGCYFEIPAWVSVMRPERVILVYNIPHVSQLHHAAYVLQAYGHRNVEVVAASKALAKQAAELGCQVAGVEPSWIDLTRFQPAPMNAARPFTVGRHSRDVGDKFHSEDGKLFQAIAEKAVVRIMGGTLLKDAVNGSPRIELLPAGTFSSEGFLHGIDAFVYRTSENWNEAWGRVVAEAMACGLPVVVDRRVGMVEALSPGVDALVFESTAEALALVESLRTDSQRRAKLGSAARQTAERLFGAEARRDWVRYYAQGKPLRSSAAEAQGV